MQRDLAALADTTFDLVVVGAGIYGALAAWAAAARGLRVALIDRGDFGGATSANSMKTLHGGLRSLQSLNVAQMRRFIRERRSLAILAPHLIDPLPFCLPTFRHHPTRNGAIVRLALAITDAVGHDRHRGVVDAHLQLPRGRLLSRGETLRLNPLVDPRPVTGGAVWYDYQMRQAERVLMAAVRSAADAGATVANYVEAHGLSVSGGRVEAVDVRDAASGEAFAIHTRAVLNAAGPWAGAIAEQWLGGRAGRSAPLLSRAMNLVVPPMTGTHACAGSVNGRMLLAVPWRDVTIVGTSHDPHDGGADAPHGTPEQVDVLLRAAQLAFPRAGLGPNMVRVVHRGLLPMAGSGRGGVRLLKESAVVDHARRGAAGFVSIFSVRYTTARETAQAAVDRVCRRLGVSAKPTPPCRFSATAYETVAAHVRDAEARALPGTSSTTRARLALTYGSHWPEVARLQFERPELGAPLSAACEVTRAEVLFAAREECARTLSDVLLRRTSAGTAGHPGAAAVDAAVAVLAAELQWSPARCSAERAAFAAEFPRSS
jgi:glycerol-3-phosphate dehydrogenase